MKAETHSPRPLKTSGLARLVVRWPGSRRHDVNCCVRLRTQHKTDAECASYERAGDGGEKFAPGIEHLLRQKISQERDAACSLQA